MPSEFEFFLALSIAFFILAFVFLAIHGWTVAFYGLFIAGIATCLLAGALAPANGGTENIDVGSIVVPKLKLRDVKRQIFPAPTIIPPTMVAKINVNWIIEGSTSEKNWPIFIEIAATFVLILFGVGYAVIGIARWLLSLVRRRD